MIVFESANIGLENQESLGLTQLPLYDYKCTKCGHRFEKIQLFSDPEIKKCPVCGGKVEKMLTAPAVHFKGSGFYGTDYKKSSGGGESKSSSSEGGDSSAVESSAKKVEASGSESRDTKSSDSKSSDSKSGKSKSDGGGEKKSHKK